MNGSWEISGKQNHCFVFTYSIKKRGELCLHKNVTDLELLEGLTLLDPSKLWKDYRTTDLRKKTPFLLQLPNCKFPHRDTRQQMYCSPLRLCSYWSLSLLLQGSSEKVWSKSNKQEDFLRRSDWGRRYDQCLLVLKVPPHWGILRAVEVKLC